jgi:predicted nuclease of predicted toxin-antitoxin system
LRFLVDECLHTSLVPVAHHAGYEAYHVTHRGKSGASDVELVRLALEEDLVVVTNNSEDFRRLISELELHPGLILIVPNVNSAGQRELFGKVLDRIKAEQLKDLVNKVVKVDSEGVRVYHLPASE